MDPESSEWNRHYGIWLAEQLSIHGHTQSSAAEELNISRPTLNRWINGHTSPLTPGNAVRLNRLASLLHLGSGKDFIAVAKAACTSRSLSTPLVSPLSPAARNVFARVCVRGAFDLTEVPPRDRMAFESGLDECLGRGILAFREVGLRRVVYEPHYAVLAELATEPQSATSIAARLNLSETSVRAHFPCDVRRDGHGRFHIPSRRYEAIILDWSNTLVNETSFDDQLCDFLGKGQRDKLRKYLDHLQAQRDYRWYDYRHLAEFCGKSWDDVVSFHQDHNNADLISWIESARFLLRHCQSTARCALATNCTNSVLNLRLQIAGLSPNFFSCIVTSDQTLEIRSKRDHYLAILAQLNLPPSSVLVIGDNLECDVLPAVELHMDACWFYFRTPLSFWGSPSVQSHPDEIRILNPALKPTFIAVDHREIATWISGTAD